MAISKKDVEYVANLARLRFSSQELEGYTDQLDRVVDYVAKLNELVTDGVEPMAHGFAGHNVMRPDVADQKPPDPILFENAPQLKDTLFQVPKIIE